ncbi:MAG TPA: hypothetical protein VLU92_01175 [Candidatus Dormibacteraeota bacterium]|nr:hypothetical protein [Candidatus Dormibacteraeota bacterium]
MVLLVALVALALFDIAAWRWGVDSRQWGLDPRSAGRPERWI